MMNKTLRNSMFLVLIISMMISACSPAPSATALTVPATATPTNEEVNTQLSLLVPTIATAVSSPDQAAGAFIEYTSENAITLPDLADFFVTGNYPCRNPRMAPIDSPDWGNDLVLCGPETMDEAKSMTAYDMGTLAFTTATPFPVDDIYAYAKIAGVVVVIVGVTAAALCEKNGIAAMATYIGGHSSRDHDPNIADTPARTQITALLVFVGAIITAGGFDPKKLREDIRCGISYMVDGTVRIVVWVADATLAEGGYTSWFVKGQNSWGGSYPQTMSGYRVGAKKDIKRWEPAHTCNEFGNFPPLQEAH